MITLAACPKCNGAVLDYGCQEADNPMCITCGWRCGDAPPEIQAEVEAHMGKTFIENRYMHREIGGGKPPLSGWERTLLRRQREREGSAHYSVEVA